ncbi:hypothetical protein J4427_03330, partial [Candidatus Woesearchaeota archaeon]|nr:hypothetical protein [Candidatus Woesearchaeota archaeon]
MVNENLIRFIVETYELPKPLEEKIFRIAYTTIKDLGLSGFDSQYRHIANLIEKFKAPYQERFFLRLDSSEDFTEKQSHEIIGFEDNNLERVIALEEENKGLISFREALGILEHELDREDYLFLNALVNLGNYDITNKKFNSLLLKDPSNIQDEIRILRNRFEINGVFLLPPRPILDLQFNPLKVKFNKIEYPGSPLPFFNKYRKIYGLLTRQQLKHFDRALHKALYKSKEMNLAIPRVFSGLLSDASIKEII